MENEEKVIEEKKENIKKWLKDKSNLLILGILMFAFIIRFYYFNLTKIQAHWWDSLEPLFHLRFGPKPNTRP